MNLKFLFLAQSDCLQRSRGESRIEPPSFHHPGAFVFYHFIIYYHNLFIMTKYVVVKASKHSPPRSILIQWQYVN